MTVVPDNGAMTTSRTHGSDDLARALAADGIAAHEARLRAFARLASRRGVEPVLIEALLDATASEVVRLRAFGRAAAELARLDGPSWETRPPSPTSGAAHVAA